MIIVPCVLCVLLPSVLILFLARGGPALISGFEMLERLDGLYRIPRVLTETMDRVLFVFLNYTFLPYFMIVPVMVASIIAANSVVGEKERKTLETIGRHTLVDR